MKKTFYSNGKLLITGEYAVLDGAKALALPTKFGQFLHVTPGEEKIIFWKSYDKDGTLWFDDQIPFETIKNKIHADTKKTVKNTLVDILHQAYIQNNSFLDASNGYVISTELTFPRFWGLGTSSTLINNIAQWLNIDAFELLQKSFGGSGYDIACAQNDTPILFRLEKNTPTVEPVKFHPNFTNKLYFVYLNQKQSSKEAIASYHNKKQQIAETIQNLNEITDSILKTNSSILFSQLLKKHESIMSKILETDTIKETLFQDFDGTVKSLGAWGGDFALVVSDNNPKAYFQKYGYETILNYDDMIK